MKFVCKVLNLEKFDEEVFLAEIKTIVVIGEDNLKFIFYDGKEILINWKSTARKDIWTEERKALWSEYKLSGGKEKNNMGFIEYLSLRKGDENGESNNNSGNNKSI